LNITVHHRTAFYNTNTYCNYVWSTCIYKKETKKRRDWYEYNSRRL